jgi:stage V sporulation protein D (sporulation-specific penicillin-binding protein)
MRRSRVLVAAAGLFLGLLLLWVRVAWLQVGLHAHYQERANLNQEQRVLVRPTRGNLLDRRGRPLARDLVTYCVAAAPREMKDARGTARRLARALRLDPNRLARAFAARPRYLVVARRVAPDVGQAIAEWKTRGLYLTSETRREYLLGPAAQEVLGRTDLDNTGVEGLELQFDAELRGQPGWTTRFRDGRGRSHALPGLLHREPTDGRHVVLTLDADLQAILESHLARALDTLDAVRAFGLFLDPRTGEVLAAANVPHLEPGRIRNWNFTDQYEPGSTYKMVVAGAALEEGVVRPNTWLEASATGEALVAPGCLLHDVHKEAGYTFFDAVRWSSNIVMARLALRLGGERYHRYATALGFGSLTGIAFPGETGGRLRSPEHWSGRSLPTLAIGHELTVTPLQLALAYAAVANGGVLMHPMLVREVRDADGRTVRRISPHAQRRVFSESTTEVLSQMLAAVVDSGTARHARIAGLRIAGKTGTAQKFDPRTRRYGDRMFVSSFVGYAPVDDPALVGVVVIDEPRGRRYYGGEVAGPVFREVLRDLRRLPGGPLDLAATTTAARPPAPAPVVVPDLRLMLPRAAEARLAADGLRARFQGRGERALAQSPAAGQAVERGASVTVWLAAPPDTANGRMPDVTGLAVRSALRRLSVLEARVTLVGGGVVVRQQPAPGEPLPRGARCRLWCEPVPASAEPRPGGAVASSMPGGTPSP